MAVNASNEAQVRDDDANTSLTSISGQLPATLGQKAKAASLAVTLASDEDPINSITVGDAADNAADTGNPVKIGGIYEAALPTYDTGDRANLHTSVNGRLLTQDDSAVSLLTTIDTDTGSISTNTSTIAGDTTSIDAKLPATLGQKAKAASLAVTLASDDDSIALLTTIDADTGSIDSKLGTLGQKTMAGSAPVVIASDQAAIPVNPSYLDVVDFFDTPLLDTSSSNIPASASTPLTVVASAAAAISKVQVMSTVGDFVGVYSDPAGTPLLEFIIAPGSDQTIEVSIPSTTVLGVRNMENAVINTGLLSLNFMG